MLPQDIRVSIVHERFTEFAGSESVVEQFARQWSDAPILAPLARDGVLPPDLESRLRTTALSHLVHRGTYAHLLPVLPLAMRHLPVPECDVVLASHHAFATQVVFAADAPVVAYVHSPARWVWDRSMRRGESMGGVGEAALAAFSSVFRRMDLNAAVRIHTMVANSHAVADRIRAWWQREAVVVHPPVDTEFFTPDPQLRREDFFLLAGRLVPYKRPELAVRAAERAGVNLVVVGEGRARAHAESFATNVRFLGRVGDLELRDLYRRCRALLMPGVEDFGIIAVEAQACGTPVIAVDGGGARDTVFDGVTGELVPQGDRGADELEVWTSRLADHGRHYDPGLIRQHAESFARSRFRDAMSEVVARVLGAG